MAKEIINLILGLLAGAVAVAVAIPFGLGKRDIAARRLGEWIQTIKGTNSSLWTPAGIDRMCGAHGGGTP